MGYVKLICFCIWAVQRIQGIGSKQVTRKPPGVVLCAVTAAAILLQVASGIALSVYGSLIQALHTQFREISIPVAWWIGIEPIVVGCVGLVFLYRRRRQSIIVWLLVNCGLCLGNGILMAYTDVLDDGKYGLQPHDLDRCRHPPSVSTTTTTAATRLLHYDHGWKTDDADVPPARPPLTCEQVFALSPLLQGLTYSLLTSLSLTLLVTILASVIGCCLQECVHEGLPGADFVPVEQRMAGRGGGSQFMASVPFSGPNPGAYHPQQGQGQTTYPQFRPTHPSAPNEDNVSQTSTDAFLVDSDRQMLV